MRKPFFRVLTMQASNQPAQLQRLAGMLKFCVYSKFINYTFQRLNNKVADKTAGRRRLAAHLLLKCNYLRFSRDATYNPFVCDCLF